MREKEEVREWDNNDLLEKFSFKFVWIRKVVLFTQDAADNNNNNDRYQEETFLLQTQFFRDAKKNDLCCCCSWTYLSEVP